MYFKRTIIPTALKLMSDNLKFKEKMRPREMINIKLDETSAYKLNGILEKCPTNRKERKKTNAYTN